MGREAQHGRWRASGERRQCLHQIFRPRRSVRLPGGGDCANCQYDPENNPRCQHYQEITLTLVTWGDT